MIYLCSEFLGSYLFPNTSAYIEVTTVGNTFVQSYLSKAVVNLDKTYHDTIIKINQQYNVNLKLNNPKKKIILNPGDSVITFTDIAGELQFAEFYVELMNRFHH